LRRVPDHLLLATLFAVSDDAIIVHADGAVISWSPAAERLFGYTAAEAVGRPIAELLADALPSEADRASARTTRTVGVRKDGAQVSLSVTISPISTADGSTVATLVLAREAAALAAVGLGPPRPTDSDAEQLNLALAAARLGAFSWEVHSDLVTFTARAAEIFGVPALPMTWTAMRELLHPDDREAARNTVERAMSSHQDYSMEYRVISGGHERWVSVSGRGRYDDSGEVLGMYGVVHDVTSDRLLLRLDDAVRSLVESEDITYTAARILGQHLDVHRCAYAFVEEDEDTFTLTGNYTNGVQSIVGRYKFRQFGEECLRLMRAGKAYVVDDSAADARITEDDRRAYELTAIRSVICVPIQKSGRFVAAMAVHMKVPRRWTAAEVELVQQVASRCWESIERARIEREREDLLEAAESANRAKDLFLAMLGHELRNPLAPILTALQLMRLKDDVSFERERTVIERQVNHLTRLVDDLLDVSRIARAKVVLKSELFELSDIVNRAIEVACPLLEQRRQALVLDVEPGGLLLEGDAARLTQVVSNLLTNASKYTPPGGRITISGAREDEQVVLRVRDTGIGISSDVLPFVFDLFVQGPQAIDRAQGGLGLGLTIVRSLVERHGGSVTAYSDGPDKGSEFVVRLPLAERRTPVIPMPARERTPVPDAAAGRTRILVVDDNEDAAEMVASALAYQGCEVHVAHDGAEALRLARAQPYHAALLDIGLPVMDGYELAARLHELPNFNDTLFVAVTGYGQESDRRRALAAGFHHHLVKPVDLPTLELLVKTLPAGSAA
jgi:PAS domain S-box-containing protein